MELIVDDDEVVAIRLSDEESETIHFALGLIVRTIDLQVEHISEREQDFNMIASVVQIEEMQAQLNTGSSVISTEAEMFLSRWSLEVLQGFHVWSQLLRGGDTKIAARMSA